MAHDPVNSPKHYTAHPSGVECIEITEHMSFTLGNVIKYLWRADLKNGVEDLQKAKWYLEREIDRRSSHYVTPQPAPLTAEQAALIEKAEAQEAD